MSTGMFIRSAGVALERILAEDDHIGQPARLDRAGVQTRQPRRRGGEHREGLMEVELLVGAQT